MEKNKELKKYSAKKASKKNKWVIFFKKWKKINPDISGKNAMIEASKEYKKGGSNIGGYHEKQYKRGYAERKRKNKKGGIILRYNENRESPYMNNMTGTGCRCHCNKKKIEGYF